MPTSPFPRTARFRGRSVLSLSLSALLLGTLAAPTVRGATELWTGTTSNLWLDGTNWSGPNMPPVSGDALVFGTVGAGGPLLNNNLTNAGFSIAGITFNAGADAFVIGDGTATPNAGNTFVLTGDIVNSGANLETINNPFSMTTARTFTTTTGGGNLLFGGVISGTGGSLTTAGTGVITLTAANTYTGGTTVNGGTLTLSRTGNDGTGTIRGTVTVNTGAILSLTAVNTLGYNAATEVTTLNVVGGTVDTTAAGDQGFNQTWNLTGGTVQSNGGVTSNTATSYFAFGSGTVVNSLASANTSTLAGRINLRNDGGNTNQLFTVADGAAATDLTVSASITQNAAVGITKAGAGTMVLSGNNNFTGNVIVNAGTLSVTSGVGLGSNVAGRSITVNTGATLALAVNNITTGAPGATTPAITINGGTLNAQRYNASGSAATANGLTLQNGGTLAITTVTDGAPYYGWQFGDLVTASGTSGSFITSSGAAGAKADLFATGGTTFNVASTGSAAGDLTISAELANQGSTGTSTAAGLNKTGAGTLVLAAANKYTGTTTVSSGTLAVTNNSAVGTGGVTMAGGTLQLRGALGVIGVNFVGSSVAIPATNTNTYGVVPIIANRFNNLTGTTLGTQSGALIDSLGLASSAAVTSFAANGGTYLTGSANPLLNGYLDNTSATGSQNVVVSNIGFDSYSVYAYFGSDVAARMGGVRIGSTTYYYQTEGNVTGYFQTTSTTSTGAPKANYAVFNNVTGSSFTLEQVRSGFNGGLQGFEIVSNTNVPVTLANAMTITGDSTIDVTGPSSSAVTGLLTIGANTLTVTGGSTGTNVPYSLSLAGAGGATLMATPTFDVRNNGTGLGSLTLGAITGAGSGLNKIGAGALTLTGANTYTGPTNVSAGTTTVSGSLSGTSGLTITSGGTFVLAGVTESAGSPDGSVNNAATVALGGGTPVSTLRLSGTLASPQSETLGALTLNANSALDFGGIDLASASSTNTLTFSSLASLSGTGFSILHWTGSLYSPGSTAETGTPAQDRLLFSTLPGGGLASVEGFANQLNFFGDDGASLGVGHAISYGPGYEIVPIPEPSALCCGLLAFGVITLRERRRFRHPLAPGRRP